MKFTCGIRTRRYKRSWRFCQNRVEKVGDRCHIHQGWEYR
jgi:hypothetical protein